MPTRRPASVSAGGRTPVAAECLDQEHARGDASRLDVHGREPRRQCRVLGGDHLKISADASLVAKFRLLERALRRRDGGCLAHALALELTKSGQVVLDVLKG